MSKYVKVAARYAKMQDSGKVALTTEHFLVDAMTLTEAETKVTEFLTPYIVEESENSLATSAQFSPIAEIVNLGVDEKWYLAKVGIITIDEKTAKEKRTITQWLVGGTDFNDAYEHVLREFNTMTISDPELIGLAESNIIEVINN